MRKYKSPQVFTVIRLSRTLDCNCWFDIILEKKRLDLYSNSFKVTNLPRYLI